MNKYETILELNVILDKCKEELNLLNNELKQKELDLIKWEKSQLLGLDACGTFDYCK